MLLSPLYKKFRNVANPEKFFKKQFIAAAVAGVALSYTATGFIVYDIAKSEWKNREEFEVWDVLSFNMINKHGLKGGAAVGLGYAGDAALFYSLAGMAYWRSRRRNEKESAAPAKSIDIT